MPSSLPQHRPAATDPQFSYPGDPASTAFPNVRTISLSLLFILRRHDPTPLFNTVATSPCLFALPPLLLRDHRRFHPTLLIWVSPYRTFPPNDSPASWVPRYGYFFVPLALGCASPLPMLFFIFAKISAHVFGRCESLLQCRWQCLSFSLPKVIAPTLFFFPSSFLKCLFLFLSLLDCLLFQLFQTSPPGWLQVHFHLRLLI